MGFGFAFQDESLDAEVESDRDIHFRRQVYSCGAFTLSPNKHSKYQKTKIVPLRPETNFSEINRPRT